MIPQNYSKLRSKFEVSLHFFCRNTPNSTVSRNPSLLTTSDRDEVNSTKTSEYREKDQLETKYSRHNRTNTVQILGYKANNVSGANHIYLHVYIYTDMIHQEKSSLVDYRIITAGKITESQKVSV